MNAIIISVDDEVQGTRKTQIEDLQRYEDFRKKKKNL